MKLPLVDMIEAVEEVSHLLKNEGTADVRAYVCGALWKAQPSMENPKREQRKAMKEFKAMVDVTFFLPADKANVKKKKLT